MASRSALSTLVLGPFGRAPGEEFAGSRSPVRAEPRSQSVGSAPDLSQRAGEGSQESPGPQTETLVGQAPGSASRLAPPRRDAAIPVLGLEAPMALQARPAFQAAPGAAVAPVIRTTAGPPLQPAASGPTPIVGPARHISAAVPSPTRSGQEHAGGATAEGTREASPAETGPQRRAAARQRVSTMPAQALVESTRSDGTSPVMRPKQAVLARTSPGITAATARALERQVQAAPGRRPAARDPLVQIKRSSATMSRAVLDSSLRPAAQQATTRAAPATRGTAALARLLGLPLHRTGRMRARPRRVAAGTTAMPQRSAPQAMREPRPAATAISPATTRVRAAAPPERAGNPRPARLPQVMSRSRPHPAPASHQAISIHIGRVDIRTRPATRPEASRPSKPRSHGIQLDSRFLGGG
jgi:hypothetical protein